MRDDRDQDVELVVAFLNTIDHEEGSDALDDELGWQRWTIAWAPAAPGPAARARPVRDALRRLAEGGPVGDGQRRDGLPGDLGVELAIPVGVVAGTPALRPRDALAVVVAAALRVVVRGDWSRVKLCPAAGCGWAFYDRSRNRSRSWCSMETCGNRAKARSWRERSRER